MVDNQPVAELTGEPEGGGDVVGAVDVLAQREVAIQDPSQDFVGRAGRERGVFLLGAAAARPVAVCFAEGVPDDRGGPEPGGG